MLFNNVQLIGLAIALLALAILLLIHHHRKSDGLSFLETRDNILELEERVYELEQKIKKFIMSDTHLWELSVDDLVELCVKKDKLPVSHRVVLTIDYDAIKDDLYLSDIIFKYYDDNILSDIIDYKQFTTVLDDIMETLKDDAKG